MQQRYMNIDTTTKIIPLTSLPGSPGKFGNCQQTRENHVFQMFFRFYKLGPCATLYPDDVLFAAVKAGRFLNVDPEDALNATCEKFIARFRRVEEACAARGAEMSSLPLDELTRLWNEAKHPTE